MRQTLLLFLLTLQLSVCEAFSFSLCGPRKCTESTALKMTTPNQDDDTQPDADGADLAAQFFKMAQAKGISLESSDYLDEDEDDEDEEKDDDEEEPNIPQGKIHVLSME